MSRKRPRPPPAIDPVGETWSDCQLLPCTVAVKRATKELRDGSGRLPEAIRACFASYDETHARLSRLAGGAGISGVTDGELSRIASSAEAVVLFLGAAKECNRSQLVDDAVVDSLVSALTPSSEDGVGSSEQRPAKVQKVASSAQSITSGSTEIAPPSGKSTLKPSIRLAAALLDELLPKAKWPLLLLVSYLDAVNTPGPSWASDNRCRGLASRAQQGLNGDTDNKLASLQNAFPAPTTFYTSDETFATRGAAIAAAIKLIVEDAMVTANNRAAQLIRVGVYVGPASGSVTCSTSCPVLARLLYAVLARPTHPV